MTSKSAWHIRNQYMTTILMAYMGRKSVCLDLNTQMSRLPQTELCGEVLQVLPRVAVWKVASPGRDLDVHFASATS